MANDWMDVGGANGDWVDVGPGIGSDLLQSLPQYGVTAASSALGLPGDILKGFQYLDKKLLNHPNLDSPALNNAQFAGSKEIDQGIKEMTGPLYQPQTAVGKGVDTAAAFLPALAGGPEGLVTKLATRVAAPAAAISGIEASPLPEAVKPWAEGATLLLSPFAANKMVGATLKTVSKGVLPTSTQMRSTEHALYNMGDLTGTTVAAPAFKAWAAKAFTPIMDQYANLSDFKAADAKAFGLINRISQQVASGKDPTVKQLQNWRFEAGKMMNRADDAHGKYLYGQMQGFRDELLQNPQLLNGPQKHIAIQAWRAGDEMHSRYKNTQLMEQYQKQAAGKAGKNYTQASIATALRQKFGELHTDFAKGDLSKKGRYFTPEMHAQLDKLVQGTPAMNIANKLSKFAPTSPVPFFGSLLAGGGGAIAHAAGLSGVLGPVGTGIAATASALGLAAKAAYPHLTKKQVKTFVEMVKKGKPVPGTPTYAPTPTQGMNYPPLLPPLALQQLLNKQGNQ